MQEYEAAGLSLEQIGPGSQRRIRRGLSAGWALVAYAAHRAGATAARSMPSLACQPFAARRRCKCSGVATATHGGRYATALQYSPSRAAPDHRRVDR